MTEQHALLWEPGASAAPLPPLADFSRVTAAWGSGTLSWEQLKQMPDLQGAMMETLRRYPVARGHRARVARPLTLAGYRLEPGQDVEVAMTVPHFLEELYPTTLQFDPPDYRLVIEEHPTPVPGNHFQVRVVERRPSSTHEERRR